MALKTYRPITPARRTMSTLRFDDICGNKPEKKLVSKLTKKGGRNSYGRITVRFRGGGHKRKYRQIDFKRSKDGIPAKIAAIHYDPNRSANIALLNYADGEKRYIIAPVGVKVGQAIMNGPEAEIKVGNCLPLKNVPVGSTVHNVELTPGKGGQLARGAGTSIQLMAREGDMATLRMPSGEMRFVRVECRATIGQVGNTDSNNVSIGKAGRTRWLGRRPHNRGVTMNPVDHPMGGGEGKTSGGRNPCSPWGKPAKGGKTRSPRKPSNSMIIRRRKNKRK